MISNKKSYSRPSFTVIELDPVNVITCSGGSSSNSIPTEGGTTSVQGSRSRGNSIWDEE